MTRSLTVQRLLALFALGALLFNVPLLRLWSGTAVGLFVVWALLIGVLAWLMERGTGRDAD
jgi:hypothetical protein